MQDLLAAVPRLRRRHPGLRVVVAGTGPAEAELRGRARALRLGRAVAFAGFVADADLAALVAAADCAVVPSRYGPFGMVALEAGAAGTPVVAADVGGLAEVVADGRLGVRSRPVPAALADAVRRLLADPELGRRLVRAGQAAPTAGAAGPGPPSARSRSTGGRSARLPAAGAGRRTGPGSPPGCRLCATATC